MHLPLVFEDSDEAVEVEGSLPVTEQSDLSDWIKSTLGQKVHTAHIIHVLVGRLASGLGGASKQITCICLFHITCFPLDLICIECTLTIFKKPATVSACSDWSEFYLGLRIRIHLIRIRIQHFRLNNDPDPIWIQSGSGSIRIRIHPDPGL
jgi:hypothetical protein